MEKRQLELSDLIDTPLLIRLQTVFSRLLGFNVAFTGLDSRIVGRDKGRPTVSGICDLLENSEEGRERCYLSDVEGGREAVAHGSPVLYRCQSFCSNFAIPIKVSREIIGFVYGGQFFARAPGERSDYEWETELRKRAIPEADWEETRRQITEQEEEDWQKVRQEISAFMVTKDGQYIREHFFSGASSRPSDEELAKVGVACGLVERQTRYFISTFRGLSSSEVHGNRVKRPEEIIHAIRVLSAIANALSEEANITYALRIYFETCWEMCRAELLSADKDMIRDYEGLGQMVAELLADLKSREPAIPRVTHIMSMEEKSKYLLEMIKAKEEAKLSRAKLLNKFFFLTSWRKRRPGNYEAAESDDY